MIRRDQRRDRNEREIIDALAAIGCSVDQLEGRKGRPDLLIGEPRSRSNILIEVKMPGEHLNPLQQLYHKKFQGKIHVVYSVAEALEVVCGKTTHGRSGQKGKAKHERKAKENVRTS